MSRSKNIIEDKTKDTDLSFISRWSRLKHENQRDLADSETEYSVAENMASENATDDEHPEKRSHPEKILTDKDMQDIESLTDDSDYTDFLSPGVSEALRKLALRKLFHSEVFNIRDGLDEYDGDYTQFEKLGSIVTSDMHHQIEMEARRKAEQLLKDKEQLPEETGKDVIEPDNKEKGSLEANMDAVANPEPSANTNDEHNMDQSAIDNRPDRHAEAETVMSNETTMNNEPES